MCLLIALLRPDREYPLLLGANRDESYGRPGEPPQLLNKTPRIWGGRDPVAGGTWLGVSETGLVVAVTDGVKEGNRPDRRSRGLICLDALRTAPRGLECWLQDEVRRNEYNPFNLFWSDGHCAWVAHWQTDLRVESLPPGLHLLANRPRVNDTSDLKLNRCGRLLEGVDQLDESCAVSRVSEVLRDHGSDGTDASCIHGDQSGTLSSTIIALHRSGITNTRYLYTNTHPCERDYDERAPMLFNS